MRLRAAALLFAVASACDAQTEPGKLARIRQRMAQNLAELPNFTCLQTIERFRRAPSARYELQDRLRLEVAQVGKRELFAWPGSSGFEDKQINELVGSGMTGTGDFSLHARGLFLNSAATFSYVGEETLQQGRALRFDYHVPILSSGLKVGVGPKEAVVAYRGSFWADASSFDLIRLALHATDIPPDLELAEVSGDLWYHRVALGERSFLLPRTSESVMVYASGGASRNRTAFARCRQFVAETAVSFDTAPETPAARDQTRRARELPAGLLVETDLEMPIDSRDAAIGDPVTATVVRDLKQKGKIVVPKGATLAGRIRRLEWRRSPAPLVGIGVQFSELKINGVPASFSAELEEIGSLEALAAASAHFTPLRNFSRSYSRARTGGITTRLDPLPPGFGFLYLWGDQARLPRGLRLAWRTAAPAP